MTQSHGETLNMAKISSTRSLQIPHQVPSPWSSRSAIPCDRRFKSPASHFDHFCQTYLIKMCLNMWWFSQRSQIIFASQILIGFDFLINKKIGFPLMFPVQFGGSSLSSQVWSITIHAINSIINHLYFAISEFCKMWSWLGFPRSILRDTVPTLILAQPFEHGWQTALDSSTLPFTPVAARMLYLSWNPGSEQVPDGFPTADSTLISLPPGPPGGQHCSTLSQRWRNRPRVFAGKAQKVNCAPQRCHVGRSCRENKSVTFWNSGSSSYREDLVGTDKKELKKGAMNGISKLVYFMNSFIYFLSSNEHYWQIQHYKPQLF